MFGLPFVPPGSAFDPNRPDFTADPRSRPRIVPERDPPVITRQGFRFPQTPEAPRATPRILPQTFSFPRGAERVPPMIRPQNFNFHQQQTAPQGLPDWYRGGRPPQSMVGVPSESSRGGRVTEDFSFHTGQRLPDFTRPRVRPYVMPRPTPMQPFIGMRPVQPPRVGARPLPALPYRPRQHVETRDIVPLLPVEPNIRMLLQQGYLRLPRVGGTMGRFGVRPPNPGRFQGMSPGAFEAPKIGRRRGQIDSATVKASGVVVILTDRSGKVLMLQRGQNQEWMGGAFDLPAMKTPTSAPARLYALQAVQAETGLIMGEQNLRCLFTAYHPEAGEVAFFHGVVEPGLENGIAVNPPEHVGYMWVDLARDNEIEGVPYMDLVTYVLSDEKMLGVSNYGADEGTSMAPLYVIGAIALILAAM